MRLTATLIATWIAAIALGAAWSGVDASYSAASYQDDPYIVG